MRGGTFDQDFIEIGPREARAVPVLKEPIVFCDVDDTLVSWEEAGPDDEKIAFAHPQYPDIYIYLKVIRETIDALNLHAVRGHSIVIWSAGGAEWAREVGRRLNLDEIVSAYMSKPTWVLDDLPAAEFIPERIRRNLNKEKK